MSQQIQPLILPSLCRRVLGALILMMGMMVSGYSAEPKGATGAPPPIMVDVEIEAFDGHFNVDFVPTTATLPCTLYITKNKGRFVCTQPATLNVHKFRTLAHKSFHPIRSKETTQGLEVTFSLPAKSEVSSTKEGAIVHMKVLSALAKAPPVDKKKGAPPSAPSGQDPKASTDKKSDDKALTPDTQEKTAEVPPPLQATSPAGSDPGGSVPLMVTSTTGGFTLEVPWPQPVAMAALSQGSTVYLAFSHDQPLSDVRLAALKGPFIKDYALTKIQGGQLLTIEFLSAYYPKVVAQGATWIITFTKTPYAPVYPLKIDETIGSNGLLSARFFLNEGKTINFGPTLQTTTPQGLPLMLLTSLTPGVGQTSHAKFVDFSLLPTQHGLAFVPQCVGLKLSSTKAYAEITHDRGLYLSSQAERQLQPSRAYMPYFFKFKEWQALAKDVASGQRDFTEAIVEARDLEKNTIRRKLAKFLLAQELGSEALAVLTAMAQDSKQFRDDGEFLVLKGAAYYMSGNGREAKKIFDAIPIHGDNEIDLWRAFLTPQESEQDETPIPPEALKAYSMGYHLAEAYPKQLQREILFKGIQLAFVNDDTSLSQELLDAVDKPYLKGESLDLYNYFRGLQYQKTHQLHLAIETWKKVVAENKKKDFNNIQTKGQILSKLAIIDARLNNKEITVQEAIENYENLRTAWWGKAYEGRLLTTLARLYQQTQAPFQALLVLRRFIKRYPEDVHAAEIEASMRQIFQETFVTASKNNAMAPLDILLMYQEFGYLIPKGAAGVAIVEFIINALLKAGLLEDASQLLETRVLQYLQGDDRLKAQLKIVNIYLMNRQPAKALKLITETFVSIPKDNPVILGFKRAKAQALMDLKQLPQALETLQDIPGYDAERLRALIFMRQNDWTKAQASLERMAPPTKASPNVVMEDLLDLASVYVLAGQEDKLKAVLAVYAVPIAKSVFKDKFAALRTTSPGLLGNPSAHPQLVAEMESYMQSLKAQKDKS